MEVRMTTAAWLPASRTAVTAGNQGLFIRDATTGTVIKRLALPTLPSPRPGSCVASEQFALTSIRRMPARS
jgi:hypothetical protein